LNEIKLYTEEKGKYFEELNDERWVADSISCGCDWLPE
jgi:hypothetical protein